MSTSTRRCAGGLDPRIGKSEPCAIERCQLMGSHGLPANPFVAKIVGGKCKCLSPQMCDV